MLERVGCDLTNERLNEIRHQIQSGASHFIRRHSNNRTLHEVTVDEKKIVVVWDKRLSTVVTVLPQ